MKVRVGVSARHIHLCKEDMEALFGANYQLTKFCDLSQKDEFACNETLIIKTDKGSFNNVRVLGPVRSYTQIEISKTDSYTLGLNPPVRNSGDLEGSESITLIGPKGEIHKTSGCIIAARHIHINSTDVAKYNFKDKQIVKVKLGDIKSSVINNVYIRVDDDYVMELHIDLDDANANLIKTGDEGEIINE